jgi:hypothetical protein
MPTIELETALPTRSAAKNPFSSHPHELVERAKRPRHMPSWPYTLLALGLTWVYTQPSAGQLPPGECRPVSESETAENVVWSWGSNEIGQLGDGTTIERHAPVRVKNLSGVIDVDAAGGHNLALTRECTVWAWGLNASGQLGDGTTDSRSTPVPVRNLSAVKRIAAGYGHSLALTNDGTVWAWGWNRFGQLGDGTTIDKLTPVQVEHLTGVTAIATGLMEASRLRLMARSGPGA